MILKDVTGNNDNSISYWNITSQTETLFPSGHTKKVNCIKYLQDGTLASGSDDQSIIIWNVTRLTQITQIAQINPAHNDHVLSMELLPNGYLASGAAPKDGTIKIWNTKNQTNIYTISSIPYDNAAILCLCMVNSTHMAVGFQKGPYTNGYILIYDMTSYTLKATFSDHTNDVNVFKVLSNGLLVSGSNDHTVKVWDLTSLTKLQDFSPLGNNIVCLEQIGDGSLVIGGNDPSFYYWNVSGVAAYAAYYLYQDTNYLGATVQCQAVVYNPKTRLLATATNQKQIQFLNIFTWANTTGDLPTLQHANPNLLCLDQLGNIIEPDFCDYIN